MDRNKYFGDMTVGVIADCLALPSDARFVMQAAANHARELGVDVTLANFQHPAWVAASHRAGFFSGPSNHGLTLSPALLRRLNSGATEGLAGVHLTRGDSDGLVNL
jgi:hypothetical protein